MQLEHSFTVPVGIEDAWRVLLDIDQIAPCMPGAAIDSVDGDNFTGTVKLKLGPIGLTYKGRASFIEKDEAAHRTVLDARGRDARGNGTANAKVTATLTESGDSTRVDVITDLDITGKPAQFGRGVMVDVGNKLIGQFADCLAGKLTAGATPDAPAVVGSDSPAPPHRETSVSDETSTTAQPRPRPKPQEAAADAAAAATAGENAAPAAAAESGTAESAPATAKAPAASAAAATSPDNTIAPVSEPGAPPTPEQGDSEPTVEEKVAPVTPLPAHGAAPPRRPADEVEPINLIESAGPAVAKRLAPILALVVLVILIARRRRR